MTKLEDKLGYQFSDKALLELALTHRSIDPVNNNERLEFLGDSIFAAAVASDLFEAMPEDGEGILTKERAMRVRGESLTKLARQMKLDRHIHHKSDPNALDKILEGTMEAVLGAIFLEAGYETAAACVGRWMQGWQPGETFNPKGELQELLQPEITTEEIEYRTVDESGPDHAKEFTVELWVKGKMLGSAKANSKKSAQEAVAAQVVEEIKRQGKQK